MHEFERFCFNDLSQNKMKQTRPATTTRVQARARDSPCDRRTKWDLPSPLYTSQAHQRPWRVATDDSVRQQSDQTQNVAYEFLIQLGSMLPIADHAHEWLNFKNSHETLRRWIERHPRTQIPSIFRSTPCSRPLLKYRWA